MKCEECGHDKSQHADYLNEWCLEDDCDCLGFEQELIFNEEQMSDPA